MAGWLSAWAFRSLGFIYLLIYFLSPPRFPSFVKTSGGKKPIYLHQNGRNTEYKKHKRNISYIYRGLYKLWTDGVTFQRWYIWYHNAFPPGNGTLYPECRPPAIWRRAERVSFKGECWFFKPTGLFVQNAVKSPYSLLAFKWIYSHRLQTCNYGQLMPTVWSPTPGVINPRTSPPRGPQRHFINECFSNQVWTHLQRTVIQCCITWPDHHLT